MTARLTRPLSSFFQWWLGELADTFPPGLRSLASQSQKPVLVVLRDSGIAVVDQNGQPPDSGDFLDIDGRTVEDVARSIGSLTREKNLLQKQAVLAVGAGRILDPVVELPLAAAGNLSTVLDSEIDRHTPFPAASAYYDFRVLNADEDREVLNIQLKVVPRKDVDISVAAMAAAGLSPVRVLPEADLRAQDKFEFHPEGLEPARKRNLAARVACLSSAIVVLAGVAFYMPVHKTEEAIALIDGRLVDLTRRNQIIEDQGKERQELLAGLAAVVNAKAENPPVIMLLAEVTQLLPDHSHVSQMSFDGGRIEISGLTQDATDIIRAFDRSDILSNAQFSAPVTRMGNTDVDRFFLTLDIGGGGN